MTNKELSQLYYLNREIEQDEYRLEELEAAAISTTAKITGLPHAGGISDKTALAANIADYRAEIEAKIKLCMIEYNRLLRYINSIDDSLIRQIITYRHINGLTWPQVAAQIGGGNTEGSIKMAYNRYLKKQE